MKNAKKYIALCATEDRQQAKADRYAVGYSYDGEKRDAWQAKANATNAKLHELSELLTEAEKDAVNEHFGVNDFV